MYTQQLLLKDWHLLKCVDSGEIDLKRLSPTSSVVIVCQEDNGEIIGVAALTNILHCEPFWVKKDLRGKGVFQRLVAHIQKQFPSLRDVVSCTKDDRVAELMQHYGMTQLTGMKVFQLSSKGQKDG